jgi:two-component system, NarL family, sensor histidine kinase DesK
MAFLPDKVGLPKGMAASDKDRFWIPLIWLPYLGFFILEPIVDHVSRKIGIADAFGTVVFLFLFFAMFRAKRPGRGWFYLFGIFILGIAFAPINGSAATFFIYTSAFAPFMAETEWGALKVQALVVATAALEWRLLHLSWSFLLYAGGLAAAIGAGNIFFAQRNRANRKLRMAHQEIEHLAKVAERERIARDLHDVLGHTLSVIILKSELAGKLIDRDPARAKAEIGDVERTSRAALADVRNTIRGYRSHSLEAELKQAKATLETAGVAVKSEQAEVTLTPAQESVVALLVREAVTNVVRHARARNCQLRLLPVNGSCLLEIEDDGRGGQQAEGNGLRGMRERVQALGGTLERESGSGTRLRIQFPLSPLKANGSQ